MESRFAHLRQRDSSVSMLRVKMSRRRSQSQKENRERIVNNRRQLDAVQELEISSLDASIAMANMSIVQEKIINNTLLSKNVAGEERLKQLQRWKERKALEKEKEKREKQRKGIFKTGLYHPKDTLNVGSLPPVPAATSRDKVTKVNKAPVQSTRVTRSMKQQGMQKPLTIQNVNTAKKTQPPVERITRTRGAVSKPALPSSNTKAEPTACGLSTRSANKPLVTAVPVLKDKPKDKYTDVRTTRSKAVVNQVAAPLKDKNCEGLINFPPPIPEERAFEPTSNSEEEDMVVERTVADSAPAEEAPAPSEEVTKSLPKASSFAPEGFLFQAPTGLSSFKFEPLTPRSADAFLTPSSSFTLPPAPTFSEEPETESKPSPPKSPCRSPSLPPLTMAGSLTEAVQEPKHDVPYFRSEIVHETERLTGLCVQWESKVEDESIPEEMRDRMRTAVGQARLLMKERFNQFSGLVDDCEFGRGEKVTTCTDLQGFWDMVYFQVEDVNKKFDALKEAEARGWVEEHKPPPRQRKVVKKPSAAPAPSKPAGTKAAAKSRLAAAKAAMKARQQAAESEKAAQAESTEEVQTQPETQRSGTVVFSGGFFQVESPARPPGSVRRSSRLSAAALPQASPSNYLTPRRVTRRSLALAQTPVQTSSNPHPTTPFRPINKTPAEAPKSQSATPLHPKSAFNVSLCFSPVKEASLVTTEQTASITVSEPEPSNPSITVVEDLNQPAEALNSDLNQCPQLSQSFCKSPGNPQTVVPSASMSFTLSPCMAQLCSPRVSCTSRTLQNIQDSMEATPDSSVNEDIPGVDFERYLQPSQRDSLSPCQPSTMESPMAMDVEVEYSGGRPEDPLTQQETVSTLPAVSTLLSSQSPQTVESALLLFTPDLKDRIRQSVCPTDLMVFTPPNL